MEILYRRFAKYYDLLYQNKDYSEEVAFVKKVLKRFKIKGKKLLDAGCGTGSHSQFFKKAGFKVDGFDLSKELVDIAKKKVKGSKFFVADMRKVKSKTKYAIITSLFSTMHYNQSESDLKKTLTNYYDMLDNGGILIFDMWFNEERWIPGGKYTFNSEEGKDAFIVRVWKTFRKGNFGFLRMAYILYKGKDPYFAKETHRISIFHSEKVKEIMEKIGYETYILDGYGLNKWHKDSKKPPIFVGIKK